ncbi:MAG TPA: NAD(P)H-hydrate dehydratase [Spirochaetia bacterium]|nr:NAD(P)H-hydrate dehydratase [Spirochaetia bacterium]
MKVVSSEAMALIDRRSQTEFAIPSLLLMEDAGVAAWSVFLSRVLRGRIPDGPMVFLAGAGNNGGDAFVLARRALCDGVTGLSIVLAAGRPSPETDPGRMLAMCEAHGIEVLSWEAGREGVVDRLSRASWIFDGIAGTGLRGALRAPLAELVKAVNAAPGTRVAIDVPSGVRDSFTAADPAVRASATLTMGLPKLCLYLPRARALAGRICVVPVGFPPALIEDPSIPGELLPLNAWREIAQPIPADTHKNRRGHLAVFAGAPGTTGAAWLCATAAARGRVGLVSLFAAADVYPILAAKSSSVMVKPWEEPRPPEWGGPDLAGFSGVLAGPGWGLSEGRERWLARLVTLAVSGVIDADGITLLSRIVGREPLRLGGRWVLTPHPGEFSRLTGVSRDEVLDDPVRHAAAWSRKLEAVIVLKGHCTVTAAPSGKYWILDGPNAALATGGAGDVLAGIIAAGIAGGMGPVDAALFGVSLHARCGRAARREAGWFLAEDLVPMVSKLLR